MTNEGCAIASSAPRLRVLTAAVSLTSTRITIQHADEDEARLRPEAGRPGIGGRWCSGTDQCTSPRTGESLSLGTGFPAYSWGAASYQLLVRSCLNIAARHRIARYAPCVPLPLRYLYSP